MSINWQRPLQPAAILVALALAIPATTAAAADPGPSRGFSGSDTSALPGGPKILFERGESLSAAERALRRNRPPRSEVRTIGGFQGSGVADWYAIAQCESGGRWNLNTGNGYYGGLQFALSTWLGYGGGPFDGTGPFPYSDDEQIVVAERVLAGQGWQAWPNCFVWAS